MIYSTNMLFYVIIHIFAQLYLNNYVKTESFYNKSLVLRAFAELGKTIISFVMSVSPSVRIELGSQSKDLH
jgi:hypothetical protein